MAYQHRRKSLQQAPVLLAPALDVDAEQELEAHVKLIKYEAQMIRNTLPFLSMTMTTSRNLKSQQTDPT